MADACDAVTGWARVTDAMERIDRFDEQMGWTLWQGRMGRTDRTGVIARTDR